MNKFDYRVLLCIPESFENAIFHMYHNSLTAFHQGHWKNISNNEGNILHSKYVKQIKKLH